MFTEYAPENLRPDELDLFLAEGWYRTGKTLFTLDYAYLGRWIRVFWLRYRLQDFKFEKRQSQIISKFKDFKVSVLPLLLEEDHENLYKDYFQKIDFSGAPSAGSFLFSDSELGTENQSAFDSWMIEVRQGSKLAAVGVFDQGAKSIAGILNYYHPEFAKLSPGKFLMLKKIEFALNAGKDWYYPGYIAHDFSKFDYKLFAHQPSAEIYDPISKIWLPYSQELLAYLAQIQIPLFSQDLNSID